MKSRLGSVCSYKILCKHGFSRGFSVAKAANRRQKAISAVINCSPLADTVGFEGEPVRLLKKTKDYKTL